MHRHILDVQELARNLHHKGVVLTRDWSGSSGRCSKRTSLRPAAKYKTACRRWARPQPLSTKPTGWFKAHNHVRQWVLRWRRAPHDSHGRIPLKHLCIRGCQRRGARVFHLTSLALQAARGLTSASINVTNAPLPPIHTTAQPPGPATSRIQFSHMRFFGELNGVDERVAFMGVAGPTMALTMTVRSVTHACICLYLLRLGHLGGGC